jgi:signal transduction histidine kinase
MRLDQVLGNLLSNAAKYRRRATPIDVAIAWGDDDVRVSVTNENAGAPISDEEADRIFDRFVRSEASLQSGLPGLGVGLYITRRLVEAHGGTITLDRSVAGRTSFHVTLPLEAAARAKSGLRLVEPVPAARSGR